ncbi:MAG: PAS domain S-box protein [Dehalococcoidia bacterium]|nr:PAS domain S-box protein [Dehalococcoidia bacterium]
MGTLLNMFQDSMDGVYAVHAQQQIILWNKAAEKLTGYSAQEALRRPCYEIMGGLDEQGRVICGASCQVIQVAVSRGRAAPGHDITIQTRDGQRRVLNITHILAPSQEPKGLPSVVHVFRDVTQQKDAVRLVERLTEYLDQHPRALSEATQDPEAALRFQQLTSREREVLALLADGASPKFIASHLHLSLATVRNHIQSMLSKLGVHTALEAVAFGTKHGLL